MGASSMSGPMSAPRRNRVRREAILLAASVREAGRPKLSARIIDISCSGCRLHVDGVFAGESVWIAIPMLETCQARVIWQNEGFAAVEFQTALDEGVLGRVVARHSTPSVNFVSDLRDFAEQARRSASRALAEPTANALREISRDCSLHALVRELQLLEAQSSPSVPSLTGHLVRRELPTQSASPVSSLG